MSDTQSLDKTNHKIQKFNIIDFTLGVIKSIFAPIIAFLDYLGNLAILFFQALLCVPNAFPFHKRSKFKYVVTQLKKTAFDAMPIVILLAFLLGAILALQSAKQLEQFGANIFVANMVALALTRELGPILISIIVAGRSGSAFASEIGTMLVTEEITALRAMGINPVNVLVTPKMLALLIGLPGLVLLGDLVGIAAGFCVGCFILDISFGDYYARTVQILNMTHIWVGIQKCFAFAIVITIVGCYRGFSVTGGAEGVGKATTNSVVDSIILIIAINSMFTLISYYVK